MQSTDLVIRNIGTLINMTDGATQGMKDPAAAIGCPLGHGAAQGVGGSGDDSSEGGEFCVTRRVIGW